MKKILMIGAGKSATVAIDYFLEHAAQEQWFLLLADADLKTAHKKIHNSKFASAHQLDVTDATERRKLIKQADLVVSMMPPALHLVIIKDCIDLGKHVVNASYVSPEIKALEPLAKKAGVILLCEMGLDPGIDHMSAMKTIHELQDKGAKITSFKSFCGGLIARESDTNPWHYKFSWNPRNVVVAGQGTAQFLEGAQLRYLPHSRLFASPWKVSVNGSGSYEAYPNRDSLSYIELYGLQGVQTFIRGTLRKKGFMEAWHTLVQLGLTDDTYTIANSEKLSYKSFLKMYSAPSTDKALQAIYNYLKGEKSKHPIIAMYASAGLFSDQLIPLKQATPAQILQSALELAWKMEEKDRDLVVMQHEFEYVLKGRKRNLYSSFVLKGEDRVNTAMARTVGLPLAIGAKLILQGRLKGSGLLLPIMPKVYNPVLVELKTNGVEFLDIEA
jgi:saccharopine dehydrogenase (NADP+, L-glutamate forming)